MLTVFERGLSHFTLRLGGFARPSSLRHPLRTRWRFSPPGSPLARALITALRSGKSSTTFWGALMRQMWPGNLLFPHFCFACTLISAYKTELLLISFYSGRNFLFWDFLQFFPYHSLAFVIRQNDQSFSLPLRL